MRKYDWVEVRENILVEFKCDICKKDMMECDTMERQEMVNFHGVGGYGSVFGDGTEFYIDMCQHCFKNILGKYVNIVIED